MAISKPDARELMSRGYEMGATVLSGVVQRQPDGTWAIGDKPIEEWLVAAEGLEAIAIAATVGESGGRTRVCPVCGTEYQGYDCPRCRQARQRLRGRG